MTLLLLVLQASLLAQQALPRSEDEFRALSREAKREVVVKIIKRADGLASEELAAVLTASMADRDAAFREGALAAIAVRMVAPLSVSGPPPDQDWTRDRAALQRLRPLVEEVLRNDQEERVRADAAATLAGFDHDRSEPTRTLNATTARILVERNYADTSPRVKARIVTVLSAVPGEANDSVGAVLKDAIAFPDARVRHAALAGMAKLGSEGRILLFAALRDSESSVRGQAAALVSQRTDLGPDDVPAIEASLGNLPDPRLRQALEAAVIRAKTKR